MRLPTRAPRGVAFATAPFADLALLLMVVVAVAASYSTVRGVGLRFAGGAGPGSGSAGEPAQAIVVAVGADGLVRVDGVAVALPGLARAVRDRLDRVQGAVVMLAVDPSAPYQTAIDAAEPLLAEGVLDGRPLSIPTRRQIEALRAGAVPTFAGRLP